MDFFAVPENRQPERVPNLGGPDYDNLGFEGYPVRQGWKLRQLLAGDIVGARDEWNDYSQEVLRDRTPETFPQTNAALVSAMVGPFVQTWIFYGLFHVALGRPVTRAEGVRHGDGPGPGHLSAKDLFSEFLRRRMELEDDTSWGKKFTACTRLAALVLSSLDETSTILSGEVVPGIVHLSLATLVECLYEHSQLFVRSQRLSGVVSVGRCRWLEERLLDRNWCPNLVKRVRTDLGVDGLYYASMLETVVKDRPHDECSDAVCVAHNFRDGQIYCLQHARRFCPCKDPDCAHDKADCPCLKPTNMEDVAMRVAAAVRKHAIPLLTVAEAGDSVEVFVSEYVPGIAYTAISHVWSDGMGNPYENTLPSCVFRELNYFVQNARHAPEGTTTAFWIDTICVPRQPNELRWAAIEPMKDVYQQAECVLVVCRELAWLPLPRLPEEILVRIFRSKWMTRLWTLQEGALAQRLAFQFEDHAIDYGYLDDCMLGALVEQTQASRLVGNRANLALTGITNVVNPGRDGEAYDDQRAWSALWTALRHRSTSRRSDEAICASILLGSDLGAVLAAANEDKMRVFWSTQDHVPSGVLWVNGPRMSVNPLHWAPASLLDVRTWALSFPTGGPWAQRTDEGLIVQGLEGFWLRDVGLPTGKNNVLEFCDERKMENYFVYRMENVGNAEWADVQEHWDQMALLWQREPLSEDHTAGVLVSCRERDHCVIKARWLLQVSIFLKNDESSASILRQRSDFVDGKIDHVSFPRLRSREACFIEKDQMYCIF